jgi:NTE family protein
MVNPLATPFLRNGREPSRLVSALGSLGIGVGREILNFYKGMVQKEGEQWPRLNLFINGIHGLMDQDYSGDINIIPSFRWYNPAKILSHLSEKELMELMQGGEHSCYPNIEAIRLCTRISRTMEDILHRIESGDLRPDTEITRPRSSRRRPAPTKADREAARKRTSRKVTPKKITAGAQKAAGGKRPGGRKKTTSSGAGNAPPEVGKSTHRAA